MQDMKKSKNLYAQPMDMKLSGEECRWDGGGRAEGNKRGGSGTTVIA